MRILDDRYGRDLRRHDLALRMIRHEVRTVTIRAWTGLSDSRIRSLFRSYLPASDIPAVRHRGPPPTRIDPILRSKNLKAEAAVAASMCFVIGVVPGKRLADPARELPSLSNGERLCYAFELYRQVIPKPQIVLEQLLLLVMGLAQRVEVALAHCDACDAAILVALLEKPSRLCTHCVSPARRPSVGRAVSDAPAGKEVAEETAADPLAGFQRPLF